MNIYKGKNGGPRPGAGRPRKHSKGVAHSLREKVTSRHPLHINFKFIAFIQTPGMLQILEIACENAFKHGFNVTLFSIQSNHIHLIAETKNNETLEKGMRSITNTIVKRFNLGPIQVERYHLHVLKSPTEVQYALNYVLHNDIRHTGKSNTKYTKKMSEGTSWLLRTSNKKALSK